MAVKRMDNVGIVFADLDAAVAFFTELGLELEGRTTVEGEWSDRIVGVDGQIVDIAMMRTPDGHNKVELMRYQRPAPIALEPADPPANTLGIRRLMFAVDDLADTVERLRPHGAELVGEIVRYEDIFLLCYLRGPEASSSRSPRSCADCVWLVRDVVPDDRDAGGAHTSDVGRPVRDVTSGAVQFPEVTPEPDERNDTEKEHHADHDREHHVVRVPLGGTERQASSSRRRVVRRVGRVVGRGSGGRWGCVVRRGVVRPSG